ncbi:MAG: DUF4978 domain-containing protein [Lentimicrobium sp.]|jgi:hypothetical protein|nr:DUF4978 domain-containing protein [Lentimicrobium sp.]
MQRITYIYFILFVFLTSYAGNIDDNKRSVTKPSQLVSQFNITTGGKVYYEVDGKPFMFIGTEIRVDAFQNCEAQSIESIEKYFRASADLGVTTVLIPIEWKRIEPVKDTYDFTDVGILLGYARKYGLKAEFLWFSTNMCGDSHSFHIPDYIWNDEVNYPKYQTTHKGWWWSYYGYMGLLWLSNPALLQRETKAVGELMNYVSTWDSQNGATHVLTGIQLYSEPDAFARWRLTLQNIKLPDGSRNITEQEAWNDLCTALDVVGRAFKESSYPVLTRTNLIQLQAPDCGWEDFAVRIFNLEGVDAVGNDSYTTDLNATRKSLLDLAGSAYGNSNFPHIAENKGSYANTPSLILLAVSMGGGYNIYDIATPKHFIDHPGNDPAFAAGIDHGILTSYNYLQPDTSTDLKDKPHTQETRVLLKGLKDAAYPLIMTNNSDIAAFNIVTDLPQKNFEQTVSTATVNFHFKTNHAGVGFGLKYKDDIVLFCTKNCSIKLNNILFTSVTYGKYNNDGAFVMDSICNTFTANEIYVEGGKVLRVKIDSLLPVSNDNTDYNLLNFENESETNHIIVHLHTTDWQTNTKYTRDLFALNPDKSGINATERCASFTGYNSANEWWYGLDIVLKQPIEINSQIKYLHAAIMTNNINADINRGLMLLSSSGAEISQGWVSVSDKWTDYVFPIPDGATDIGELRFMFNHQAEGLVTYLDEIIINNDPNPRMKITDLIDSHENEEDVVVYPSEDRSIEIRSVTGHFSVKIYDISGNLIFNDEILENRFRLPVHKPGVYLVKSKSKVFKVCVK